MRRASLLPPGFEGEFGELDVAWDGHQYVVVWTEAASAPPPSPPNRARVRATRLTKDLEVTDAPALVLADLTNAGFSDIPRSLQVLCRTDGVCLTIWNGSSTFDDVQVRARLWSGNAGPGPALDLPMIGRADGTIAVSPDGFLITWGTAGDKPELKGLLLTPDGKTQLKTLAVGATPLATTSHASSIWTGTNYVVAWQKAAYSFGADLAPLKVSSSFPLVFPQMVPDGKGGVAMVDSGGALNFLTLSADLVPAPIEVQPRDCINRHFARAAAGFILDCEYPQGVLQQIYRSDQGVWSATAPKLGSVGPLALALAGDSGVLLNGYAWLDAYPLAASGGVTKLTATSGGLVEAHSNGGLATGATDGSYVYAWDQDTPDFHNQSRFVRISASGEIAGAAPQSFRPGGSGFFTSLAASPGAILATMDDDAIVRVNGDVITEEKTLAGGYTSRVVAGDEGFLWVGWRLGLNDPYPADTRQSDFTYLARRNLEGVLLDDPPVKVCEGLCTRPVVYASASDYLLATVYGDWMLVKPNGSISHLPKPPGYNEHWQIFGGGGKFFVARDTDTHFAELSEDGTLGDWRAVTAEQPVFSLSYFSFGAQEVASFRLSGDVSWQIADRNGPELGPISRISDPSEVAVDFVSKAPGLFMETFQLDDDPYGGTHGARVFKQLVPVGSACVLSRQCRDAECVDGTCQPAVMNGGGASGQGGAASEVAGAGTDEPGGNGPSNEPSEGGAPAATPASNAGERTTEAAGEGGAAEPASPPHTSSCSCNVPQSRVGDRELWLAALALGLLRTRRRR